MERLIDLHTHTAASDGSMHPGELVRHAKEQGLFAVAITDHDTVDGIEAALEEGEKSDIEVVPGIEISVDFNPEMHILGYFFGDTYHNIKGLLADLKRNREERNPKIVNRLNELGFGITMNEVEMEALGAVVGRPHIAKVLIKKGYVHSVEEAFEKYLSYGKPAYFKKDKLSPQSGIGEIIKAGGVPVLAHPRYLYFSEEALDQLLCELAEIGLKGVEANYVDNTPEETARFTKLAAKHHLIVTGGSDFHGSFKPDIEIGRGRGNLRVNYEVLEELKK